MKFTKATNRTFISQSYQSAKQKLTKEGKLVVGGSESAWGGKKNELFYDISKEDIQKIKDGEQIELGHWVLLKIGDEYEATRDGLYMEVFSNIDDMLSRRNQIHYYEYDEDASADNDAEIFTDEDGNKRVETADRVLYKTGGKTNSKNLYTIYKKLLQTKYNLKNDQELIEKITDDEDTILDKLSVAKNVDNYDIYELSLFTKYNVTTHKELITKITDEEDQKLDELSNNFMKTGGKIDIYGSSAKAKKGKKVKIQNPNAISLETFEEKYKPQINHILKAKHFDIDPTDLTGWGGIMYETYGDEYDYVRDIANKLPKNVWTLVEGDDGDLVIIAGWHFVNRMNYVITEKQWVTGDEYVDEEIAKHGTKADEKISVSFYKYGEYMRDEQIDLIDLPVYELNEELEGFTIRPEDEGKHFYANENDIDDTNADEDGYGVKRAYATTKSFPPKARQGMSITDKNQSDKKVWEVSMLMNPIIPSEIDNPKHRIEKITLGAKSNKLDVEQAIKRMGLNIMEILSIREIKGFVGGGSLGVKYRAEVGGVGENRWSGNSMEYDTPEEAKDWLNGLAGRWFGYNISRVVPVNVPINQDIYLSDPLIFQNYRRNAKGTKIRTNSVAVKELIKDLDNTPHSVGIALLRERLLTHAQYDLKQHMANAKTFENPVFNTGMYEDLFKRIIKELNFDKPKLNDKAVKELIKDLGNTPHEVGLGLLRERMVAWAENDLAVLQDKPEVFENPIFSVGMYKDLFNRMIKFCDFAIGKKGLKTGNPNILPIIDIGDEKAEKGMRTHSQEDKDMLYSQTKQITHHGKELNSVIKNQKEIEPWVLSKMGRATSDISDVTHYLDGKKMKTGGRSVGNQLVKQYTETKGEKGFMVFNYTDDIYASPDTFPTKAKANEFIAQFRLRFSGQGYYRDNRWNKVAPKDIDLLAIPQDFNPFNKN